MDAPERVVSLASYRLHRLRLGLEVKGKHLVPRRLVHVTAIDSTLRMSELAEVTDASLSRLSHLVKRLEERGLIRREPTRSC